MVGSTGLCLAYRFYIDKLATIATLGEHYDAINEGIDRVILAETYIQSRMVGGATLTLDDVACLGKLTTKNLDT